MAILFRAVGTNLNTAAATTLSPVVPATAKVGDFLLAVLGIRSSAAQTYTKPAGWTEYTTNSTAGTTCAVRLFYKFAASADINAAQAFGWTSSVQASISIIAYIGVDASNPIGQGGVGASTTTTVAWGSLGNGMNNILLACGTINKAGTMGTPASFTSRVNGVTNQGLGVNELASEVTFSTVTSTYTTAANNCAITIALTPSQTPQIRSFVDEVAKTTGQTSSTPAATQIGDLNIAYVKVSTASTITTPANWTQIYNTTFNTAAEQVAAYYKFATAVGAESPTWTFTGGGTAQVLHVCITGTDGTNPIDISGSQNNASSASVVAPSVTETSNNDLLLFYGAGITTATWTAPLGLTSISSVTTKNTYAAYENESTGVVTSTNTATIGVAGVNFGSHIAVRPPVAAPTIRGFWRNPIAATTSFVGNGGIFAAITPPDGDLVIISAFWAGDPGAVTVPTGFVEIDKEISNGTVYFHCYIKQALSEPSAYPFSWTNSVNCTVVVSLIIGPAVEVAVGHTTTAASATVNWPSLTQNYIAGLLLYLHFDASGGAVTTTQPAGLVEVMDDSSVTSDGTSVGWEMMGQTNIATGARTGSVSTTPVNTGLVILIAPTSKARLPIPNRYPIMRSGNF